eukprot:TRINITY_DN2788_c0_g1_i10.p2 TRINITY_DN2788_c0_g1~~TRINITY_DN2788_c0_g1_i10.p2  ORF type:complete len:319 (-),score=32.08 TRINITY_DN2788_c0_g1_i10:899-1855(-)
MDTGYYVAQTLAEQFGLIVFPAAKESMFDLIQQGVCVAAITDSTFVIQGLVPANVDSLYKVPYGVAISKTPNIPNLADQIQEALIKMLIKKNNDSNVLENLENKYLILNNVNSLAELPILSDAITANNGRYIGEDSEDAIWKAANLTSTRNYADELRVIDPSYDKNCRQGLRDIYNALANGVAIADVPIKRYDDFSYTVLLDMTPFKQGGDKIIFLRHPILQDGITIGEIGSGDPNQVVRTQIDIQEYLKNQGDGTFYYVVFPLERTYTLAEFNSSSEQLVQTTRTMMTTIRQTIVGKGIYKGRIFTGLCHVGETSDW